ncbi:hypothetical protein [Pseudoalteromonas denitrificans]|uniref:Uncharacterized protein n=1 Tax=Pseudoalteromonas denitrificans DSM 6059 TaxID=1123010 RepID=A0A1I1F9S3_9GAMM|nr:hypothetical protein [Pseudoalteromonas denitrificans]SFB96087.1 hypothetical protein SAMN02745724_00556 [Pseudoalteromonas denitrificans DSM 6059]
MKKLTIASMLLASVGATVIATPAFAADTTPAQTAVDNALAQGLTLEQAVEKAIQDNPELAQGIVAAAISIAGAGSAAAESVLATAISAVGPASDAVQGVLNAAANAGIAADTVTAVAVASNVDPVIASQPTAAGNNSNNANNNNANNNANDNGQQANNNNANNNAGAGNNNSGGNSSGSGGGGGGTGISEVTP